MPNIINYQGNANPNHKAVINETISNKCKGTFLYTGETVQPQGETK